MRSGRVGVALFGSYLALWLLKPDFGAWTHPAFWVAARQAPEVFLIDLVSAAGWLLGGWLLLVTILGVASRLPNAAGRTASAVMRRLTPTLVRGGIEALIGVSLAVGPAGAALANSAGPLPAGVAVTAAGLVPVPAPIVAPPDAGRLEVKVPSLDRPAEPSPPATTSPAPVPKRTSPGTAPDRNREVHVVVAGDTLWGLASSELAAGASPRDIADAWHRWYDANRRTIGPDPDLLLPGQVLTMSTGTTPSTGPQ